MIKKFLMAVSLIFFVTLTVFSAAEAARPTAELMNIFSYDVNERTLRVEIVYRGEISESDIYSRREGNSIIIDLNNTTTGRINKISGKSIRLTKGISNAAVDKISDTKAQVTLDFDFEFADNDFSVQTQSSARMQRKFSRIVVDVAKPIKKSQTKNYGNGAAGHVVVLDAGHGGSDNGAVGPSRLTEKEVTLAVALKTERLLRDAGAEVIMTRRTDIDVAAPGVPDVTELQARVDKAPYDAEIFISIHCNAFSNPKSNGMETFYYGGSSESKRLATLLNEELLRYGGLNNRGVKSANFYVIKHTSCPASLIELAFITNYNEERLLADEDYQERMAQAIVTAIDRFFNE